MESNVQNTLARICKVLNCRLDLVEAVLPDDCESEEEAVGPLAQGELIASSMLQNSMKNYRFKQNRPKVHSSEKQNNRCARRLWHLDYGLPTPRRR